MKDLRWSLLSVCALISGCIVDSRQTGLDGGGCSAGGSSTTVYYCSIDADCASGLVCSTDYTCVTSSTPSCVQSSDCAAGSYCDAATRHCVTGTTCVSEPDCPADYNCNLERGTCEPASTPTCGELMSAADCGIRADCRSVYAGVDCSCGTGCTCQGGEPGCVCQSFQFFECSATP
jgi:hypothetical protein